VAGAPILMCESLGTITAITGPVASQHTIRVRGHFAVSHALFHSRFAQILREGFPFRLRLRLTRLSERLSERPRRRLRHNRSEIQSGGWRITVLIGSSLAEVFRSSVDIGCRMRFKVCCISSSRRSGSIARIAVTVSSAFLQRILLEVPRYR